MDKKMPSEENLGRHLPGAAASRGRRRQPLGVDNFACISATVVSSMRFEKPHSLSYHDETLTRCAHRRPDCWSWPAGAACIPPRIFVVQRARRFQQCHPVAVARQHRGQRAAGIAGLHHPHVHGTALPLSSSPT